MTTSSRSWKLCLACLAMSGAIASFDRALAQIVPDGSLEAESSVVTPNADSTDVISGGATRGANLFHSFEQFSVETGRTAFFNNAADIQNIISRVTGKSISNIDGWIRANGAANVFLLNPNGIMFGRNARLNIGGSFVASTASSLTFADGFEFGATASQTTPLLTVNIPIGLQFGGRPGSIQVQGDGQGLRIKPDLIDTTAGLRVSFDQTLALVGGNLDLEGATLKTAGGRIELGSVAGDGLVNLTSTEKGFALSYEGVQNLGNIQLTQQSAVDASGAGGGDLQIWGRRVTLTDNSRIEANTLKAEAGGAVTINARELLEINNISDNFSYVAAYVYPGATGDGGNITIDAGELLLRGRAQVSATTFGSGRGGNLTINVNKVQLIGTTFGNEVANGLYAHANQGSTGNGGNLTINTRQLLIQGRGIVSASTLSSGKGGDLTITSDTVQITGVRVDNQSGTGGLYASTSGAGNAGNLMLNTQKLLIQDGGQVNAITASGGRGGNLIVNANTVQLIGTNANSGIYSQANPGASGDAGNLTINTQQLLIQNGAQVSASTLGGGKGGNLTVNADQVQVNGTTASGQFSSLLTTQTNRDATGNAGNLTINTQQLLIQNGAQVSTRTRGRGKGGNLTVNANIIQLADRSSNREASSGFFTRADLNSTGAAGDLRINTQQLQVRNGAGVFVESLGTGNAGNLTIDADSIRLDNGTLTANTRSVNTDPNQPQATINLRSKDLVLLSGSNITTNATGTNVIGGNINIDTDALAALEDSDISANSDDFRGGRIRIEALGVFGTQSRNANTPESDITAIGDTLELSGTIEFDTPDTNPNRGLVKLPVNLVDASQQISQSCTLRGGEAGSFVATGRGGLPPTPYQSLGSDDILDDVRLPIQGNMLSTAIPPDEIVEAQGWTIAKNGEIALFAQVQKSEFQRCRLQ